MPGFSSADRVLALGSLHPRGDTMLSSLLSSKEPDVSFNLWHLCVPKLRRGLYRNTRLWSAATTNRVATGYHNVFLMPPKSLKVQLYFSFDWTDTCHSWQPAIFINPHELTRRSNCCVLRYSTELVWWFWFGCYETHSETINQIVIRNEFILRCFCLCWKYYKNIEV